MTYAPYRNESTRSSILAGIQDPADSAAWARFFDTYAGYVFGIARHRIGIDGPGVTSLVGVQGCPLACRWCINAKLLKETKPEYVTPQTLFEKI